MAEARREPGAPLVDFAAMEPRSPRVRPAAAPKRRNRRLILGLDEAGRGPALGPLVVAGVALEVPAAAALRRRGVKDSKDFGPGEEGRERRRELAAEVRKRAAGVFVRVLSAAEVDRYVEVGGLNALERRAADEIVTEAGPVRRIVADGARLFGPLAGRYPHLEALDRGESHHAAVAAASVVAKARRDELFAEIAERHRAEFGEVRGGGYVNRDTEAFLRRFHAARGRLPEETRLSWRWSVIRELNGQPRLFGAGGAPGGDA